LLKLIPPDAGVVLTVDDLRGQVRELLASRLAAEFQKLPAVKAWFDSEKYEELERARDNIEGAFEVPLTGIRDQVLGDAVVLALRLPSDPPFDPSRARGILALKAGDPALLKRLIDKVNTIQQQNGEIAEVAERVAGDTHYFVRVYPDGSGRLAEAYVLFPDGTFAISNATGLVSDLIGRKTARGGGRTPAPASLAEQPRLQALDRQLPEGALARLFVDARLAERLLKNAPQPKSPGEQRGVALIRRYIEALDFAGAALVARDGRLALHTAETFEPRKFQDLFGRSPAGSSPSGGQLVRLPSTTLAVGSLDVDLASLHEFLTRLVPEPDQPRLANLETALSGIFLGQDLRTRILPGLGPRILAFVDAPADSDLGTASDSRGAGKWPFPTVLALELGTGGDRPWSTAASTETPRASVAAAVDNAMRTLFAVLTLDEKRAHGRSRIVAREVAGVTVTTLDPPTPLAYAVDRASHRLILGTSPDSIARYLQAGSAPEANARFRRLQAAAFPGAHSFLCVDLAGVEAMAEKHRDRLTKMIARKEGRSADSVSRDLDQAIALAHLFDAAFVTSRIDPASATIHHTLGLLARQAGPNTPSTSRP
jgi:hypothetical protein